MKKIYLLLLLVSSFAFGQGLKNKTDKKQFPAEILEIETFQKELNREYKTEEETPLRGSNFKKFKSHPFFPIDLTYRVKAKLVKTENAVPFEIPTSSGRTKKYREFGKAYFTLNGAEQVLTVYQSLALLDDPEYQDYLFLPFKDELIIDFNKAYHPLCAYNATDYSCPIVPQNNWLQLPIEAGVKYQDIWFEH